MNYYCEYASPLGKLLLAAGDEGLRGIYFDQQRHFNGVGDWQFDPEHGCLPQAVRQVEEYFAGTRTAFDLPLDLIGTQFQRAVWHALLAIPYGATVSYAQHANALGKPDAARAVGTAIGRNPISLVVPCHRVVGSDGSLTGYAGGLERKRALLAFETQRTGLHNR